MCARGVSACEESLAKSHHHPLVHRQGVAGLAASRPRPAIDPITDKPIRQVLLPLCELINPYPKLSTLSRAQRANGTGKRIRSTLW